MLNRLLKSFLVGVVSLVSLVSLFFFIAFADVALASGSSQIDFMIDMFLIGVKIK